MDDSILARPDEAEINQVIEDIKAAKLNITVEGDLQDFLGVRIKRKANGEIHFTQPQLIDKIIKMVRMEHDNVKVKETPVASLRLLLRHSNSPDFDKSFDYQSVLGMYGYLEKATRSDIAYIMHQCQRFTQAPKVEHGNAI